MKCAVRPFEPYMMKKILEIELESFPSYPYDETIFITMYYYQPEFFLVAVCDGEVVGYVCGFVSAEGCGHLASIAVSGRFRRRGIGSILLEKFEKRVAGLGLKCVKLEVSEDNYVARTFYERRGYSYKGTIPRYYPDGKSALIMEKNLSGGQ